MKREASIHIREGKMAELLAEVINEILHTPHIKKSPKDWAKEVLEKAKKYSCSSRIIIVSNDKLLRKTEKLKLTGRNETGIFAQVLLHCRRLKHHRGLKMATPGSQEWLDIKEACKLATEFCQEFNIELKLGYKEYITIGLEKLKNFSVHKFKTIHSAICKTYDAQLQIAQDKTPQDTEKLFKAYLAHINEKVGYVSENYKNIPEKYVCFVYAKRDANELGVDVLTFTRAQFAGAEWHGGIPDPLQLYGDKAREHVIKYCYSNNIRLGKPTRTVDFAKVFKIRNDKDINK